MTKLKQFFCDENGHVAIWQWPNLPLRIWIAASLGGHYLHGNAKSVVSIIGTLALVLWAALEVYSGKSPFRRVLGAVIIISMCIMTARLLL